jgi:peroxiredoxin
VQAPSRLGQRCCFTSASDTEGSSPTCGLPLGCTPQALAFRDHATELAALGARVVGLSVVAPGTLVEFSEANHIPFPVIADPERRLETALRLPTFQVAGVTLYRRVTLIAERGTIVKVFYPVFPPERNANEVIAWLSSLDPELTDKQPT